MAAAENRLGSRLRIDQASSSCGSLTSSTRTISGCLSSLLGNDSSLPLSRFGRGASRADMATCLGWDDPPNLASQRSLGPGARNARRPLAVPRREQGFDHGSCARSHGCPVHAQVWNERHTERRARYRRGQRERDRRGRPCCCRCNRVGELRLLHPDSKRFSTSSTWRPRWSMCTGTCTGRHRPLHGARHQPHPKSTDRSCVLALPRHVPAGDCSRGSSIREPWTSAAWGTCSHAWRSSSVWPPKSFPLVSCKNTIPPSRSS